MPKRKLKSEESVELSDLSPPPNDLLNPDQVGVEANGVAKSPAGKKRKTEQVKKELVETESHLNGAKSAKAQRATRKKIVQYQEPDSEKEQLKATPRGMKRKVKLEEESQAEQPQKAIPKGRTRKVKVEEDTQVEKTGEQSGDEKKVKRKRKTKEEKEAEAMPLAARTLGHKLNIGAHVSSAGGTVDEPSSTGRLYMLSLSRRAQLHLQQSSHRCQRLCPLSQKPTEMGKSTFSRRRLHIVPR